MENRSLKTPVYNVTSIANNISNYKPLPPSPSSVSPSSIYSGWKEDTMDIHHRDREDAILPPHIFLQPTTYSSSTSNLPDPIPVRPRLACSEHLFPASDWSLEKPWAQEARSGDLPLSSHGQTPTRLSSEFSLQSPLKFSHNVRAKSAEQHAVNYESVLHTRSSVIPSFNPEPYYAKSSPSAMTARITDVIDTSLCPSPLRTSGSDHPGTEVSRFSSSSSDRESAYSGIRNSLKSRAKKALHIRQTSVESTEPRPSSSRSSHNRRSSLQQGLSDGIYDMYETLTNLSVAPSSKPKSTAALPKSRKSRFSAEAVRSPDIPSKAAQILGTAKPFDSPIRFPKTPPKTPRSAKFAPHGGSYASVPFSENYLRPMAPLVDGEPSSVAGKLASVFQSGTQQIEAAVGLGHERGKRTRDERRREELKRKIVVVKTVGV